MGKTIDELSKAVEEAHRTIKRKKEELFIAECALLQAETMVAIHCSPLQEGDELQVTPDGEVVSSNGVSLGVIHNHHMLGHKLKVEKLEARGLPPYYRVRVRKSVGSGDGWSRTIYTMPYPNEVALWKKEK